MDTTTVLRSRIAAAAVGVTVLGITAALVPTVSNAADDTVVAATPNVGWADSSADFTRIDLDTERPVIPEGWSWFGLDSTSGPIEGAGSLDDVATFGADGLAAKPDTAVYLLHGFTDTVTPAELPAVVRDARAEAGANTVVGLLIADASDPRTVVTTAYASSGLAGDDATWDYEADGAASTADLATELAGDDRVVFGTIVGLTGEQTATPEPEQTATPEPEQTATSTPAPTAARTAAPTASTTPGAAASDDSLERFLPTEAAPTARALRAAVAPADSGIASLRIDDTTTYFTPKPTTKVTFDTQSLTLRQASTTGFTFTGTGFAPGESIRVALTQSDTGTVLPVTVTADADGAFSGSFVVPATTPLQSFDVEFLGTSSGQAYYVPIDITADPSVAPVATPVPGRATFTG